MRQLIKYIPFFNWIRTYNKSQLSGDITAGLTVGIMLIPQGMAYALIAGLPPVYGLYAALIPQVVYMFLGTSRQLSVGPVAMDSLLVATIVSTLTVDPDRYIEIALLLAFLMGIIQFVFGILRFGFLVNFLSKPVISAFTSAAAIIIGLNQFKHITGTEIERNSNVVFLLKDILYSLSDLHVTSLVLGVLGMVVLFFFKKHFKKIPGALILVVLGTLFTYLFNFNELGVKIVGDFPAGLPSIRLPNLFDFELLKTLIPSALTIALIAFMESISVAKAIEEKHSDYTVDPNQEMIALGASNIIGSIFSSYPVTGGFSRSAVNDQAGAKTGISSLISALLIFIVLLFFTSTFYFLPKALLGSIILVAVYGLLDFKTPIKILKTSKVEFFLYMLTFISTLTLGIQQGIGLGVLFSLLTIIYFVSNPHMAEMGRIKERKEYMNKSRFNSLEIDEGILIIRIDARLFYANFNYFKDSLDKYLNDRPDKITSIIISAKAINDIDYTAIRELEELICRYLQLNVTVYLVEIKGPVRDKLNKYGFTKKYGKEHCFFNIESIKEFLKTGVKKEKPEIIFQNNNQNHL